jgi:hypothetical protein
MQRVAVQRCCEVLRRVHKQRAVVAQTDWLVPDDSCDFAPSPCSWFQDLVTLDSKVANPFVTQFSRQFLGPLPALSRPVTAVLVDVPGISTFCFLHRWLPASQLSLLPHECLILFYS